MKTIQEAMRGVLLAMGVSIGLALPGCSPEGSERADLTSLMQAEPSRGRLPTDPVAQVRGETLFRDALEVPLRIRLYELQVAAHRLRLERRDAWIRARVDDEADVTAAIVEDAIAAPVPPRFELPRSVALLAGEAFAPIVVTQFVDFASSHSRRLQPVLATLVARHPELVRIEDRLLPLPFHRHARGAAEAAHCALEQSAYVAYAERLLLDQTAHNALDLRDHAERMGLELDRFDACLASNRTLRAVERDLALARSIGVDRAATVFVNGRYVSGRPDLATLERVVEEERLRLGAPASRTATGSPAALGGATSPVPDGYFDDPVFVRTLSPARIAQALTQVDALASALDASRATYSGERLLSIRELESGGLYDQLGFEEGDVLFAVDGEFVTLDRNPFFEALARGGVVRLLVMRSGRPMPMEIRIEEGT